MDEKIFNFCLKNINRKECFDRLYNYFYKRIVVYIMRLFGNQSLGEDVAQECFITLLNLKEIKYIKYYTSWLYKICENIALRKLNKESAEERKYDFFENVICLDNYKIEPFGALQKAIEKLDKETKDIFYLRYVEAYSLKEIAPILNVSYDTIRKKHAKGINILRKSEKASQ